MSCILTITFKRIQEFLFSVPRLKAMTGANALLGETLRNRLTKLAVKTTRKLEDDRGFPKANQNDDPLQGSAFPDDPAALIREGILSRDGGHFHALFPDRETAENFIREARRLIARKLPGVSIETRLDCFDGESPDSETTPSMGQSDTRLPQLQICQDTGTRVANEYRSSESPPYVSAFVEQLEKKGDAFKKKKTDEIIGLLLQQGKLPTLDSTPRFAKDLCELAGGGGYIAVIHADGNNMGARRHHYAGASQNGGRSLDDKLAAEAKNETFFHAMRVAVRKAVVEALNKTFTPEILAADRILPYQLLMLGGDDLLLITRPEHAFPFLIAYAQALEASSIPYDGEKKRPLSIGAGIAIASCKLPFHRLHHLAENLAGSAKKLYRDHVDINDAESRERSVVDWMVATTSWMDEVEQSRLQTDLSEDGKTCISAKPYFILPEKNDAGKEKPGSFCLKTLHDQARALIDIYAEDEDQARDEREKTARSRMKRILQPLHAFDHDTCDEWLNKEGGLPEAIKKALFPSSGKTLWHEMDGDRKLTRFKDFMELVEIHYLGRKTKAQRPAENNHQREDNP